MIVSHLEPINCIQILMLAGFNPCFWLDNGSIYPEQLEYWEVGQEVGGN